MTLFLILKINNLWIVFIGIYKKNKINLKLKNTSNVVIDELPDMWSSLLKYDVQTNGSTLRWQLLSKMSYVVR